MIGKNKITELKDDEMKRENQQMKQEWCGSTIFHHDKPTKKTTEVMYLDTPVGLVKMNLTSEEKEDVTEVYNTWLHDVYELVLKPSQTELNSKYFNKEEKGKFDEADLSEWRQFILNKAVELVPRAEEGTIPKEKIISAPMRYVRTNKNKDTKILEAKSRLIIPGHTDPEIGMHRTDAPTTTHLAVIVAATIAVSLGFDIETFDVTTAFLSGMAMTRKLYTKAPPEGLPATEGWKAIRPYQLLQVLKGAYGLTEAPRLWYLRARQILVETIGFVEMQCARAVFVYRQGGELIALLTLHVDDGMVFGNKNDPRYKALKARIDKNFKIKDWKSVGEERDIDYTGMQWRFEKKKGVATPKRDLIIHMDKYIKDLTKMPLAKKEDDDRDLNNKEMTEFKSYLAKARWPVAKLAPELVYGISALAQGEPIKQILHVKALNEIIDKLHKMREDGLARLRIQPMNLDEATLVTVMDASFANEPGKKSQGGFFNLWTIKGIAQGPETCNLTEFQTSTIPRIVRSTMAAESAILSIALDRHLYLRLLMECLMYGEPELASNWRHKLKIPGTLVTDSKSTFDHLTKTGSIPTERQTLIDLLVARDLSENNTVRIMWLPNKHMIADCLTKAVKPNEVYRKLIATGEYSLIPSKEQQEDEDYRLELRQGQRKRAKERKKAPLEKDKRSGKEKG